MNLVVHIPYRADEESSRALSLARQTSSFTMAWVDGQKVAIAIFYSLPTGIDLAIQLIGEAVRLSRAWASVNSKRMSSLIKLWQRLVCYRDSLAVYDSACYCREKSALFNTLVGCDAHRCPVPCQFLCTHCKDMAQEGTTIYPEKRFEVVATLAEIDWCPRLKLPAQSGPSRTPPLNPSLATT